MMTEEEIRNKLKKLENEVKSSEYQIIIDNSSLFDEIEKQNPSVKNELIKILKDIISQNNIKV